MAETGKINMQKIGEMAKSLEDEVLRDFIRQNITGPIAGSLSNMIGGGQQSSGNSGNGGGIFGSLPPEAKVTMIQFDSDKPRLKPEEEKAVSTMNNEVPQIFIEKGYDFKNFNFADLESSNPDLKFQIEKLREATKKELDVMYKQGSMEPEKAYQFKNSVGSLANYFSEKSGADLILLLNYEGFEKSDGMVAKDVAASVLFGVLTGSVYVEPSEAGVIQAALIDGTTGNLLWTNVTNAPSTTPPVQAVFKELPNKTSPMPNKK